MSNVIGQAIIEVVGSGTGFEKSVVSETESGFKSAEVAAAESGTKIGNNLKGKFGSAFGGVASIAKVAIGVGLAEAFKTGFEHVEAVQSQMSSIEAGLKTTGDRAGLTAEDMKKLAENIQGYSGQSEEATLKTEQLLLTFTNIRNEAGKNNDVFTQTTKLAADMGQRFGTDTATQAIRLGKALNDPVLGLTSLQRVGITFTAQQKEQIKAMVQSGNTMGAQKLILDQLNQKFGGTAEAYGKTLPGSIAIAKLSFEDIAGNIVQSMMPAFNAIIDVVQVLLPILGAVAPILGPLAIGIFAVVAAVKAWNAVQEVLDVLLDANPIILVVAGLAVLAVALVTAYKHSQEFRDIVKEAFKIVQDAIDAVVGTVKSMEKDFTEAVGAVVDFVKAHWILLVALFTGPIGLVVAYIVTHFGQIEDAVHSIWNTVTKVFGQVVSFIAGMPGKIASAAAGMWDGIKEAFRGAIDTVIGWWNSLHFHIPGFSVGPVHFGGVDFGVPKIPEFATGGNFNGFAIAGEYGPELIAGAGKVYSRNDTQKMLGSGVTIHPGAFSITIQGSADKDMVQTALDHWSTGLAQALRRRGVVTA